MVGNSPRTLIMLLLIDLDGIFIYIDEVSKNLEKTERRTKDTALPVSIKASKEQLTLFKTVILIKLSPMLKVDFINKRHQRRLGRLRGL